MRKHPTEEAIPWNGKGGFHAEKARRREGKARSARRQIANHGGRRICPRGNQARATRQARSAISATGNCHRPERSAPGRHSCQATQEGQNQRLNEEESAAGLRKRPIVLPHAHGEIHAAQPGSQKRIEERAHKFRQSFRSFPARKERGQAAPAVVPLTQASACA